MTYTIYDELLMGYEYLMVGMPHCAAIRRDTPDNLSWWKSASEWMHEFDPDKE